MIDFRKIGAWIFGAFFFFLPLFYVPKLGVSYILSQKLLVVLFVLAGFSLWAAEFFEKKKTFLKKDKILLFLAGFWLMAAVSFFLAPNILQGFLGRSNTLDSFFMLSVYVGIALLSANFLNKENLPKIFQLFILGSAVLSAAFLGSLVFNFKTDFFIPIENFSFVFALAFSCLLAMVLGGSEYFADYKQKVLAGVVLILLFIPLLIIQAKLSWFIIFLVAFMFFWREAVENNFVWKQKKIFIPLFVAIIALVLFFAPKLINVDFQLGYEQSISYSSGLSIAQKTLQESIKNIFFGSGPATYIYKYSLYKGDDLGDSMLVFNQGPIAFLTLGASLGILAFLFLFAAWIVFVFQGFAYWQLPEKNKNDLRKIIFSIGLALFLAMFLSKMTIVPMVFAFFLLGAWVNLNKSEELSLDLKPNDYIEKAGVMALILLFFAGAIVFGKQYAAEAFYQQGVRDYGQRKIDSAMKNGLKATTVFGGGDYYIGASQLCILKASDIFNSEDAESRKKEIQALASQGEALAKLAAEREPQNYNAWYNLGLIYENTSFLVTNKNKEALAAYQKSQTLAPYNFDVYYSLARIFEKQGEAASALVNYEKAFTLNPALADLEQKIKTLKK